MRLESTVMTRSGSWGEAFFLQITMTTIYACLTPIILWFAGRFRVDARPFWRNGLLHLLMSALFACVSKTIWLLVIWGVRGVPFSLKKYLSNLVYAADYGMVLYWMVIVLSYLSHYYRRYQKTTVDAANLQTELAQAQLRWLKAQLHPHFLFNALHAISALIREDADAAERMIARLSDLLRRSLRDVGAQEVPLREELEHVGIYLEIERARFEERLVVSLLIEDETREALVPSLVLQPLVENAIRHGIGNRASGGHVTIASSRHGPRLALSVSDDGVGLRSTAVHPAREGIGLSTIRGRLERLYGRSQSLILRNLPGGGVEAFISIPFNLGPVPTQEVIYETA